MEKSGPKKVLIVQTAFIGDVILVTPLIRASKELYPNALLDTMVVPTAAALLKHNPHLNQVISFNKKSRISIIQIVKQLRAERYDLVISPHSSFTTHLVLWLSGIRIRIGFARGFLSSFLMTAQLPHPKKIHKIKKNLSLLRLLSPREFSMQTELFPGQEECVTCKQLLDELGHPDLPLIAIAPGSIWNTKCWPHEYYAELAQNLIKRGCRLVLIGGGADYDKCEMILLGCTNLNKDAAVLNSAGRSDLLTSAAILEAAELLICNDSGALHIANAMQTQVFAIFGPTVQGIGYYPFREGDRVFETDLDCRPCGSHGGNKCPLGHHNCMRLVKPETVLNAILSTLEKE